MNQKNITSKYAGVDVSKAGLDCWKQSTRNQGGSFKSFANNGKGIRALLKWIPEGGHVVAEATGGYEELLVCMSHNLGAAVSVVNPGGVRKFADAQGRHAKTDRLDAALIARYAEVFRPASLPKPTKAQMALASHVDLREGLVNDRTCQLNRLDKESNPSLRVHLEEVIDCLGKTIAKIEKQIDSLIASCPKMTILSRELRKIPGIGPVISSTLIALPPELGTLTRKEVAALCGLAPYARYSGKKKGRRYITAGRAKLRRRLYMGATATLRTRTPLAAQYRAMVARGKDRMVALIAVARKLAIRANTLCKPFASLQHADT